MTTTCRAVTSPHNPADWVSPMHDGVCSWHETDMRTLLRNVRSKEQSGKHMLPSGFSGFDSKRASGLGAVAIATIKSVPLGKV